MFMSKQKFTKLVAGLIVTSTITVGAISPSSAMASQPNYNNDVESNQQYEIMQEYFTNRHAASQFTFNEDGDLIHTVTPKADFRSHNRNFQNVAIETPVIDVELPVIETPVIDEETPVVDTPVVDGELPVVETPVIDGETPVVETPVIDEETPVVDTPVVDVETPVIDGETIVVETPVIDEETPVVETPVIDGETPVVDTPVIDEEATDASIQNSFYTHLFDAYDKLLSLYDKLLSSFLPSIAN